MKKIEIKKGTKIYTALIDDQDFEHVSKINWYIDKDGYAVTSKSKRMHRVILEARTGDEVDHINRNKIDNRRCNLRIVSHHENCLNRSRGIGVSWKYDRNKWRARIKVKGIDIHVGYFNTKLEALQARKNACINHFGEYAFVK